MTTILVADDSSIDRQLIGGLLAKGPGWQVQFAHDGEEAVRRLDELTPTLLLTDMQMPRMSGLELVSIVKEKYPRIPVILITGKGSESLAVEALSRGAASYVPKSELASQLVDTVTQVLNAARLDVRYEKLSECLVNQHFTYYLDNDPNLFHPLIGLVQQAMVGVKLCDHVTRVQVGIALEEALLNAMVHGNLELAELLWQRVRAELRKGIVAEEIVRRREEPPYRDRLILVDVQITVDQARIVIGDEGPGIERDSLPHELGENGRRGLVLIKAFMDEVRFNRKRNEVTMIKRRPYPDAA